MVTTKKIPWGLGLLSIILIAGAALAFNSNWTLSKQEAQRVEATKPAAISLILLTPSSCEACVDGTALVRAIESQNVRIESSDTFEKGTGDATAVIAMYAVKRLPAVVVSGEYGKEPLRAWLEQVGGQKRDGVYIIEPSGPVYFDLARGEPVGLVDVTYVWDSSCADCYDVKNHRSMLENGFGVKIRAEDTVDIRTSDGRSLMSAYALTEAPALLLSGEAKEYTALMKVWPQVGSIEPDGTFVFRNNQAIGEVTYKRLDTGEIITPPLNN